MFYTILIDEKNNSFVSKTGTKSNPNKGVINLTISQSDSGVKFEQRAFSASRVDYDRPSLEAIGSGAGAQTHGWG